LIGFTRTSSIRGVTVVAWVGGVANCADAGLGRRTHARSPDVAVTYTILALAVLKPIAGNVPIVARQREIIATAYEKGHPTDIPVSARSRGFLAHLILVADSMCRAASQAS
jgi:hypothetical protein